jgi:hypothetical protein
MPPHTPYATKQTCKKKFEKNNNKEGTRNRDDEGTDQRTSYTFTTVNPHQTRRQDDGTTAAWRPRARMEREKKR